MTWLLTFPARALRSADIIGIVIGILLFAFVVWPGWLGQARDDGARQERADWVEKQEEARAKQDAAIAAAQRRLDAAEKDMLAARADVAIKSSELEAALAAERVANDEAGKTDAAGARCLPRRMPERVRRALNAFRG